MKEENEKNVGTVFWITGLPRSGKTTLAASLCAALRMRKLPVAALDGDAFRAACSNDLGYDRASRLQNGLRLSGMCELLAAQGLIVVCSTVSLFSEIHEINRARLKRYVEVVLNISIQTRQQRDPALYGAACRGEAPLPGVNQDYVLPLHPHVLFDQLTSELDLTAAVAKLLPFVEAS